MVERQRVAPLGPAHGDGGDRSSAVLTRPAGGRAWPTSGTAGPASPIRSGPLRPRVGSAPMTAQVLDGNAGGGDRSRRASSSASPGWPNGGSRRGSARMLVGDDGPSANYVAMKHRDCAELGIASRGRAPAGRRPPAPTSMPSVDALQRRPGDRRLPDAVPVPRRTSTTRPSCMRLDPAKDADGLHPVNLGRLVMGVDGPVACTPAGIVDAAGALRRRHRRPARRDRRSGPHHRPAARQPAHAQAARTPTPRSRSCTPGWPTSAAYTRQADILVAAAGSPGLVTADMVKPGAVVVGAGRAFDGPQGRCPTSPTRSPRWRRGCRRASAGSAP